MKMHMWIKYWWTDSQMANYSTASGRFILKEATLFLVLLSMQQPWGLLSITASLVTPKFIFSLREMLISTLYWSSKGTSNEARPNQQTQTLRYPLLQRQHCTLSCYHSFTIFPAAHTGSLEISLILASCSSHHRIRHQVLRNSPW